MCTGRRDRVVGAPTDVIPRARRPLAVSIVEAVLATIALFALAGWIYIAANAVAHPASLGWPLTHLARWPREDTFGIVCFATSFVATLALRILRVLR